MKTYTVIIPYLYEFTIEANDEKEALEFAHSKGDGRIIGCDDANATVEEIS